MTDAMERAVEANHYRYDKLRRTLIPAHPGYYWALWLKAADGTHEANEVSWPAHSWEIVQVNDNNVEDPTDDEYLSVSVPGIRETQWREYFKWGPFVGPIASAFGSYPAALPLMGVERTEADAIAVLDAYYDMPSVGPWPPKAIEKMVAALALLPKPTGQPVEGEDLASRERQEGERSAKDFAIEFAGYMATSTEHLLQYLSTPGEADAQLSTELIEGVRSGIYEFRKRAEKAASPPPPVAESGWQEIESAPKDEMFIWAAPKDNGKWSLGLAYRNVSGGWSNAYGSDAPDRATHWMPLPAPPHIADQRPEVK